MIKQNEVCICFHSCCVILPSLILLPSYTLQLYGVQDYTVAMYYEAKLEACKKQGCHQEKRNTFNHDSTHEMVYICRWL